MGRKIFKIVLLLAALAAIAIGVSFLAPSTSTMPEKAMPNPNGYDDLVFAGQLASTNNWKFRTADDVFLRELAATNAAAVARGRLGLTRECRVILPTSATQNRPEFGGLKCLAEAFLIEGRIAENENRPGDAAKSCLDAIHLGTECARGGLIMDGMVGTAIESLGLQQLQKLIFQLDAKASRETAARLEQLDTQREPVADLHKQEEAWVRRIHPGLKSTLAIWLQSKAPTKAIDKKFTLKQEKIRQVMIQLAARAYELEKGRRPASVADLVPDYLKAIPKNPETGTNMVLLP